MSVNVVPERCVEQLARLLKYFNPNMSHAGSDETVAGMIISHWERKLGRDAHGTLLIKGQAVLVHQNGSISSGVVERIYTEQHSLEYPGCWVEVLRNGVLEGMPSYYLSVIPTGEPNPSSV